MAVQYNTNTQFDRIGLDITDVDQADILVTPILRLVFVPSSQLFQEQIWTFKDNVLGAEERLLLEFSSVLYKKQYPLGSFSAQYGVVDANNNYRLLNKLEGEVDIDSSLGVPLPNGQYMMTQYNYELQDDPVSLTRIYFSRGLCVGVGIIIDIINSHVFVLLYNQGQEMARKQYKFTDIDYDIVLSLASPTQNTIPNPAASYKNFKLVQ
jgi:hypothetical protein